jgi:PKD repeat protein
LLARLRSPNDIPAIRTAAGAHHWRLQYLEFAANKGGYSEIIRLGDGSSAQNSSANVPHHLILEHLYVHGDPIEGQKRGIATNAAHVEIRDSHISDIKGVGMDTQALGGWNGPGPFVIENNYIEAAGENLLFGGSDPYIAGLVADGLTIRRNYFSRPMAWKDPILGTPAGVMATAESGGTLTAGTYAYRVVARRSVGQGTTGRSSASVEVSAQVANGGAVRIRWQAVSTATTYRVYGRTPGGQNVYWSVSGTEFVDSGTAGTAEAVPTTAGTVWTVKNVFELKNARNVLVEANIFENHWKQAQPGYSIVLTPRNSGGTCNWCTVENVTFQYNLIRNVSAGINLLGYDSPEISDQANNITIRHNLFTRMVKSLGGNAWFMLIGDEPRDITIENNTIDSDGSTVVSVYGGNSTDPREVYGLVMRNNATRHSSYGMHGSYFAYGNGILANYYPDAIFQGNYLAGGSASRYPAGNYFSGLLQDQFVDVASGNYAIKPASLLYRAGTDGQDVGVAFDTLMTSIAGVDTGTSAASPLAQAPTASFEQSCDGLTCSFTSTSTDADGTIVGWSWSFGDGVSSPLANPSHSFAAGGTYNVTLTITDDDGASSSVTTAISVTEPPAPLPSPVGVHVGDLAGSKTSRSNGWKAHVTVRLHNATHGAVSGATVTYRWVGRNSGTCVTSAAGECKLKSALMSSSTASIEFEVLNITSAVAPYTPNANHDPDGSSNGTTIKVTR